MARRERPDSSVGRRRASSPLSSWSRRSTAATATTRSAGWSALCSARKDRRPHLHATPVPGRFAGHVAGPGLRCGPLANRGRAARPHLSYQAPRMVRGLLPRGRALAEGGGARQPPEAPGLPDLRGAGRMTVEISGPVVGAAIAFGGVILGLLVDGDRGEGEAGASFMRAPSRPSLHTVRCRSRSVAAVGKMSTRARSASDSRSTSPM